MKGRHGATDAKKSMARLRYGAGSAFETLSRLELEDQGLIVLTIQHEVFDEHGSLIGRSDFGFGRKRVSVLGEADGRKIHDELKARSDDALREAKLRLQGYEVVRWTWGELLNDPAAIVKRVNDFIAYAEGRAPIVRRSATQPGRTKR